MALHGRILSLKQDSTHLHYRTAWPANSASRPKQVTSASNDEYAADVPVDDTENLLRHYFSLKHNATALYELWSQNGQQPLFGFLYSLWLPTHIMLFLPPTALSGLITFLEIIPQHLSEPFTNSEKCRPQL